MPPRNKRKRPVKAEPPDSDSEYASTSDEQAQPKRAKAEVKEEVKVEELGGEDFAIVLSDCELSDSFDRRTGPPVRRSAGGRPPRRGVDVAELYEEAVVGQLARSLGQVVKEEECETDEVSGDVQVEDASGSPFRVSDYVRRVAAVRAEELLRGDEHDADMTTRGDRTGDDKRVAPRRPMGKGKFAPKFTQEQREFLRAQFDADPYPDRTMKEELSEQFGVEYMCVQYWFKDERRRRGTVRSNYDSARKTCVFGSAVHDKLVAVFERNQRPDLATRRALAVKADASVKQISDWFQKRRKQQIDSPKTVEITPALRVELEAVFKTDPYPDRETRTMIAENFGSSMKQITKWFGHQRHKAGIKDSKEEYSRRSCQFGPEGYDRLVAQFEFDPYPDVETRVALAAELGGTAKQVFNWFRSRRANEGIASRANEARNKCVLGPAAYDELVAAFEADPYPDLQTREALAAKTGGTPKQITDWFCWRRQKEGIQLRSDSKARSMCKFGARIYDELVAQFEADPFPDSATVKTLAQEAGGTHQQIKNWFSKRRKRLGTQRSNEERKRQACKFGPEVYDQLVAQFEVDPYPSTDVIEELAESAGATAVQIRSWFEYRRKQQRRQKQQ